MSSPVKTVLASDYARAWLKRRPTFVVAAVYTNAAYLRDRRGDFLLLLLPSLPPDPLALRLAPLSGGFSSRLRSGETGNVSGDGRLQLPRLTISTTGARRWHDRPDWEWLHASSPLALSPTYNGDIVGLGRFKRSWQEATAALILAVADGQLPASRTAVARLAGLGPGLTPAGDDFLLGLLFALWAVWPAPRAAAWGEALAEAAAARTTPLSAAWLRAAAHGAAGGAWHELVEALLRRDDTAVRAAVAAIRRHGATSGAAAWDGFRQGCRAAQDALAL